MTDSYLPHRFVPVGQTFFSRGKKLIAVERPSGLDTTECCSGCAFNQDSCPRLQCSKWDRRDGKNVWFKEVDDG